MVISRRVAWVILLGAIFASATLRQFHSSIPSSPFLPGPIGSLLFFLVLILFLVFVWGWGARQEIPYAGRGLSRVNFLALIPFLIALMFEKWVSITLFGPLFHRINGPLLPAGRFNALYLIESALGLLLVSVLLLPLFRRLLPLLRRFLGPRRLGAAALQLVLVLGGLYALLGLLFLVAGGEGAHLRWSAFGRHTGLIIAGQALIAFAEELYYRGILQTETSFLLPAMGLTNERIRLGAGVALISLAFALEHFAGLSGAAGQDLRRFIFIFACSLFLGALLVLLDNLWFTAGCHFVLNLFILGAEGATRGGGLQFVDDSGRPLLDPAIYIYLFFALAFVIAYASGARTRLRSARAHRAATAGGAS